MSRPAVWSLYALLVAIWSSTWVAIKVGLDDTPPLLGAGVRFALAGVGLLVLALLWGRSLRTDRVLASILGVLPFAGTYGLIYWGEQYVPSGLAAVLFGVLPIYVALIASVALRGEPLRARLFAGVVLALGGLRSRSRRASRSATRGGRCSPPSPASSRRSDRRSGTSRPSAAARASTRSC